MLRIISLFAGLFLSMSALNLCGCGGSTQPPSAEDAANTPALETPGGTSNSFQPSPPPP